MTSPVTSPHRPRIAVLGASLEASTHSPGATLTSDFVRLDGEELLASRPWLAPGTPLRETADWVGLTHYRAIPGAPVPAADWAEMTGVLLGGLERALAQGPLDGVLLDVHGAMSVVGTDDPEAELAAAVRRLVGPDCLVSTGMDLHGNVSELLAQACDLLTCYRMAPHEDAEETKERAARNLVDRLLAAARGEVPLRPLKARVPVPVLLPGEKTSTRVEPAASLYALVPQVEARPGVLDAGIWIGYAWADLPRSSACVVVTGDDEAAVRAGAEELARAMWAVRDDFAFVAPTGSLAECLDAAAEAVARGVRPFFVSDSGDNPTAGGSGDATWTLTRLLERPEVASGQLEVVYASVPDAEAARAAAAAGVGARVQLRVGARVDDVHAPPVALDAVVEHVHVGDPVARTEVVLRTGGLRLLLTERRKPYHLEGDFLRNGIDARAADVVVVKIGYLEPELFAMAADWRLALTPGGVDQDLARLPHERIARPMHPYDAFGGPGGAPEPSLEAVLVGGLESSSPN
ncbi:M81 family metallopeptidase [Quadrisphaera sp. RL12-1S]|uniref:M81 family metallopeptidase n=1 Tax=Quadrisphaera sp. RL12-1S TaxID=2763011 RepID=UPI001645FF1C|nr:M81 family metallopeptidase [Quadrisphaera sp. RL12-1S]